MVSTRNTKKKETGEAPAEPTPQDNSRDQETTREEDIQMEVPETSPRASEEAPQETYEDLRDKTSTEGKKVLLLMCSTATEGN